MAILRSPETLLGCGLAAVLHLALASALCLYGGWQSVIFSLAIPSIVAFSLGGYIFYAQHNFPDVILTNGKKCLQLKLWDEDLGRMISMREFNSLGRH